MEAGSFDPTNSQYPFFSPSLNVNDDYQTTGFAIIQLHERNGLILDHLSEKYDFDVLEHLSEESWIIRLSEHNKELSHIEDSAIRWIGPFTPDARISIELSMSTLVEGTSIDLIPSPDLSEAGLNSIVVDLLNNGADMAWCGYTQCQFTVGLLDSQEILNLKTSLAMDSRILFSDIANQYRVHNSVAAGYIGLNAIQNGANFTLNGSGETIAITDTGLDRDHPDLNQTRIAGVFTNFGLDPSFADSNSGHGTHVAITVLGDGSGDSNSIGIAPEANLVMYALEHDPTGVFGRQGSIYDLLVDAEQRTARISVNAWGANGGFGEYTSDSRSVDTYVSDNGDLVPLFSVGDQGANGDVAPPSTAKNVISVGCK